MVWCTGCCATASGRGRRLVSEYLPHSRALAAYHLAQSTDGQTSTDGISCSPRHNRCAGDDVICLKLWNVLREGPSSAGGKRNEPPVPSAPAIRREKSESEEIRKQSRARLHHIKTRTESSFPGSSPKSYQYTSKKANPHMLSSINYVLRLPHNNTHAEKICQVFTLHYSRRNAVSAEKEWLISAKTINSVLCVTARYTSLSKTTLERFTSCNILNIKVVAPTLKVFCE